MINSVSFPQFLLLCFILYLIFGDPVYSYHNYKHKRMVRLVEAGLIPHPPLDPWTARVYDIERDFNLLVKRLLDIENFVFTPDLCILNKKELLQISTSMFDMHDTTLKSIKSFNILQSDFWVIKSDFELLKLEYQVISEQLYSITSNLLTSSLDLLLVHTEICQHSINQFNAFLDQNQILNLYSNILLARIEEFNALQSRFLNLLKFISTIQTDFRREHAEFVFEKDCVLRQLELYKETLNLNLTHMPFQFKKKKKNKKK